MTISLLTHLVIRLRSVISAMKYLAGSFNGLNDTLTVEMMLLSEFYACQLTALQEIIGVLLSRGADPDYEYKGESFGLGEKAQSFADRSRTPRGFVEAVLREGLAETTSLNIAQFKLITDTANLLANAPDLNMVEAVELNNKRYQGTY